MPPIYALDIEKFVMRRFEFTEGGIHSSVIDENLIIFGAQQAAAKAALPLAINTWLRMKRSKAEIISKIQNAFKEAHNKKKVAAHFVSEFSEGIFVLIINFKF